MNKYYRTHTYLLYILLVLIPPFLMCASSGKAMNCGLASKYDGTTTLNTHKTTLIDGLQYLLLSFNDSVSRDTIKYLWGPSSSGLQDTTESTGATDIHNISKMTGIIKGRGYSVAMLEPATYESIDALSKLPVLIMAIIIHHPDNANTLISDTNLTLSSSILEQHADNIRVHLIDNITKENNTYKLSTREGLVLQGLETDNLSSQIISSEDKTGSRYLQIVNCIIVSSLPLLELSGHLNEWYASIPYRNIKPVIKEFP